VLARIEQHVRQRVAHLAGSSQSADVVAAEKYGAHSVEDAIDSSRYARADRLHPTSQRLPARCFDDEMQVIALDRELGDAELTALARRGEATAQLPKKRASPE
jgi:hypothetical protein